MTYNITTTLNRIRAAKPCKDGWEKLLSHLGKTSADDEPLQLMTVLDSNGLDDALWVLSFAMPDKRLARHFQAWCAEQVLHLFESERPEDTRVRDQIAMLRNDSAGVAARTAAWAAARDAARSAAWGGAARSAAWAAARDAARDAARTAAWAAAWAAALSAARAAAWGGATWDGATWDAARDAQEKQLRKMIEAVQ